MRPSLVLLFTMLCMASPLRADMLLQLGQGGSTSGIGTNFTANAGSSMTLDVWVTQRGTFTISDTTFGEYRLSNDPSTTNDGLAAFTYDIAASDTNVTVGLNQITVGPGFSSTASTITRPIASFSEARVNGFGEPALPISSGLVTTVFVSEPRPTTFTPNNGTAAANSILLGTVTFAVGANVTNPFTITASNPFASTNAGALFFSVGTNPIAPAFAIGPQPVTATINVNAVPEPTTWLFGTALVGLGVKRWRRRV